MLRFNGSYSKAPNCKISKLYGNKTQVCTAGGHKLTRKLTYQFQQCSAHYATLVHGGANIDHLMEAGAYTHPAGCGIIGPLKVQHLPESSPELVWIVYSEWAPFIIKQSEQGLPIIQLQSVDNRYICTLCTPSWELGWKDTQIWVLSIDPSGGLKLGNGP